MNNRKIPRSSYIKIVIILILSNSLWISISFQKQDALYQETEVHTNLYAQIFREEINERINLMKIFQSQWVNDDNESKLYDYDRFLSLAPQFWDIYVGMLAISWINISGYIKWVYPVVETTPPLNISVVINEDGTINDGLYNAKESGNVSLRFTTNLIRGGIGYTAYYPLIWNNSITGFFAFVFRSSELIEEIVLGSPDLNDYSFSIFGNQTELYQFGEIFDLNSKHTVNYNLSFYDHSWQLYFCPISTNIRDASPLGNWQLLIFGILLPFITILAEIIILTQKRKTRKTVSEKKKLETQLKRSESDRLLILENLRENVIYYDNPDLSIKWANKAAKKAFSKIIDHSFKDERHWDILNQKCYKIWYGKSKGCIDCPVLKAFKTSKESRLIKKSLDGKIWSINAFPAFDKNNKIVGVVEVMIDITVQNKMEENLRHSQKMDAVGRLAGGIAHDFNNFLTVINGYCELILNQIEDENPIREDLQEVSHAGKQAAFLTQQLLKFSRKQIFQTQILDLNEIIANMNKMLTHLIGENVEYNSNLGFGEYKIEADPNQIEQIIMNLVINARDAMPKGGILTIETQNIFLDEDSATSYPFLVDPGMYVLIIISDTGIGMSEEIREHIFEPFFTTKPQGKGTGLGLSTVFGIVKQSNGFITVHSELGKGTQLKVYLPQVNKPIVELKKEESILVGFEGHKTVLFVEDNDLILKYLKKILESNDLTVLIARDGIEAIEIFNENHDKIDLLITDIIMPRMSGIELINDHLLHIEPNLKVLLISGYSPDTIKIPEKIIQDGNFLQKPFTASQLIQKINYILRIKED
ncbi:ATP-binding protein [Promethearchaeum syntrophicum]|uniref:ATP-binding protein n=1 Tax=Promethearchaeum syntrophicum TaxID=2594042 RepID=A0A5B9DA77_9ARCH